MTGLFKRRWTDKELDQKLDTFTTFTSDSMMPLEYARAVARRYGASEDQVLLVVLKRVKEGRIRLVNGRIPVRKEGEARIRTLIDSPQDAGLAGWGLFRRLIRYYMDCVRAEGGAPSHFGGRNLGKTLPSLSARGFGIHLMAIKSGASLWVQIRWNPLKAWGVPKWGTSILAIRSM